MINLIWFFCAIVNLYFLVDWANRLSAQRKTPINFRWLAFFSFFCVLFGPVWTGGMIFYSYLEAKGE